MEFDIDVTQKRRMKEYWVIRGISTKKNYYECISETEVDKPPTLLQIGTVLANNPDISFCSVEHNYKLLGGNDETR